MDACRSCLKYCTAEKVASWTAPRLMSRRPKTSIPNQAEGNSVRRVEGTSSVAVGLVRWTVHSRQRPVHDETEGCSAVANSQLPGPTDAIMLSRTNLLFSRSKQGPATSAKLENAGTSRRLMVFMNGREILKLQAGKSNSSLFFWERALSVVLLVVPCLSCRKTRF